MTETVYTRGAAGEMGDIVDFINYVFSQAHRPHDFKTLLPKVYADDAPAGQEDFHFLAKQNGRIVACVADRPLCLSFGENALKCGYVGSVSVHPYHRSEGHMKRLMSDMIRDAREKDYDLLLLGGQRQRYGYFGFEKGGLLMRFHVTGTNVRHALSDVDISDVRLDPLTQEDVPFAYALWQKQPVRAGRKPETFLTDLMSWHNEPLLISFGSQPAGYLAGGELVLQNEDQLPKAVKALLSRPGVKEMEFRAALYEKQRLAFLKDLCEYSSLGPMEMFNVLNWKTVLETFLCFKHLFVGPVADGCARIDIKEDGAFEIEVKNGVPRVTPLASVPESAIQTDHMEAQRTFFGLADMFVPTPGIPDSWKGLPLVMSEQDGF